MKKTTKQRLSSLLGTGLVALSLTAGAFSAAHAAQPTRSAQSGRVQPAEKKTTEPVKATVIMRDGNILEGRILSETDTQIEFEISVAGIKGTRTIDRADILDIKKVETKPEVTTTEKTRSDRTTTTTKTSTPATAGPKVYFVPLTGEFQRDVALTPMKRVMEDAKKAQPDIIVFKVDCEFKMYGEEIPEWADEPGSFDQLELARQIDPLITDAIREDPEWKVKPRMVFWIRRALGGVAFLPFLSPEIYYTSDARHGGIGYLDYLFEGVGDEVVREKQRSLRLGRAQGLALKGGHPVEILNAMARVDYVLSVDFVGGKPVFREDMDGEMLLTDDGNKEAGRRDAGEDVLRFTGNDVLTLTASTAERLGMSSGTVDTEDQLFDKLGIARNNPVKVGKAEAIFQEWSKGVTEAEFAIRRLWRELGKVQVRDPGGWNERQQARGRQKAILKEILAILEKYKESINPYAIQAMPDQMITRCKLMIDQIEQEMRRDKK